MNRWDGYGPSGSPVLANLSINKFEVETKETLQYFPRIWLRYVDEIFAIFDTKIPVSNF